MGNKTAKTKKKNPTELTEVKLFMKIKLFTRIH